MALCNQSIQHDNRYLAFNLDWSNRKLDSLPVIKIMKPTTVIANALYFFGNWVWEFCMTLGQAIDGPILYETDEEKERNIASTMTLIQLVREHKCPTCQGHRVLRTEAGDDWYRCDNCGGTGIDPVTAKEGDLPSD